MTAAKAHPTCCRDWTAATAHHNRLRTVDVDIDELLALLELAVTWHELDYSARDVVGPAAWLTFAHDHEWTDPERAERAFSLALDVVGRGTVGSPALAHRTHLRALAPMF